MGRGNRPAQPAESEIESPEPAPEQPVASESVEPAPKKRDVPEGHVRVRCLKGVLMTEGFFGAGHELVVSIAEYERRESRGEFELID